MKKIISAFLVLTMLFSMSTTAFAKSTKQLKENAAKLANELGAQSLLDALYEAPIGAVFTSTDNTNVAELVWKMQSIWSKNEDEKPYFAAECKKILSVLEMYLNDFYNTYAASLEIAATKYGMGITEEIEVPRKAMEELLYANFGLDAMINITEDEALNIFATAFGVEVKKIKFIGDSDLNNIRAKIKVFLRSFSDINQEHWAYTPIMHMAVGNYAGLFSGTTETDENGIALFSPDDAMTRAEFIAVMTRALYSSDLAFYSSSDIWYANNFKVADKKGLLNKTDYVIDEAFMNMPISRQEAALLLENYMIAAKEDMAWSSTEYSKTISKIPDYNKIENKYSASVPVLYLAGLLTGVDDEGNFNPYGQLTRAEGATVLFRLIEPAARLK